MSQDGLPPIWLKPKYIADKQRLDEVKQAILRYVEAGYKVPVEWIQEYNELIELTTDRKAV